MAINAENDQRLAKYENRFDKIDKTLSGHTTQLSDIQLQLKEHNQRLMRLESGLEELKHRATVQQNVLKEVLKELERLGSA